jgi:hypothetical protein
MSDEEKKKGEYEKPESHGEGDELEGVSGGAGSGTDAYCGAGSDPYTCATGATPKYRNCLSGNQAGPAKCTTGTSGM